MTFCVKVREIRNKLYGSFSMLHAFVQRYIKKKRVDERYE